MEEKKTKSSYFKVNKTKFRTKSFFNPKHNNTTGNLRTVTITNIRANLSATPQLHCGKLSYFFNQ